MLFWLSAALLTIAASLAVLWPLARGDVATADAGNDLRVYKDQLAEIDAIWNAVRSPPGKPSRPKPRSAAVSCDRLRRLQPLRRVRAAERFRAVALIAVLSVPVVSWGLYSLIGSPELPSQPLQARLEKPPAKALPKS